MTGGSGSHSERIKALRGKEQRGSRPRCLLLTEGSDVEVVERINALIAPAARIELSRHRWAPRGFDAPNELELDKAVHFLPEDHRRALRRWWLAVDKPVSSLPTWDLVATASINGREGLVLVEAKAHRAELGAGGKTPSSPANDARIAACIDEACADLNAVSTGWAISASSHYQLSNRFAWAWKLAREGVPVVLIYLGFTGAEEMSDLSKPIADDADWVRMMAAYGEGIVPETVWHQPLDIAGTPLIALRRTLRVPLPNP